MMCEDEHLFMSVFTALTLPVSIAFNFPFPSLPLHLSTLLFFSYHFLSLYYIPPPHPDCSLSSAYNQFFTMVAPTNRNCKVRRIGKKKGAVLRDVNAWRWIKTAAAHFKREGKIMVPNCTEIMKSSHGRERAPQNKDWYYIRCAAVLRALYLRPGEGYGGLSKRFAKKKNNGSRPEHTVRAATGLLHWACKSLSKLGLLEKVNDSEGNPNGQRVTKKGRKVVDSLAFQVQIRKFNGKK
ncbi:small subunit ribosomal protein S19e [Strigomonas culicis]|uniref:Small subunit ribosomal protein S19e n=1 Tax=Strigomonas culicis TaxID=28005 RepID=S9UMJ0_9TRYP|nr:small subunit ribosomal protein S19e [Strigomonas culicis]|eukprot:EPY30128.1 small subunit ribosomal protein S19e [Strigomonas culicis]